MVVAALTVADPSTAIAANEWHYWQGSQLRDRVRKEVRLAIAAQFCGCYADLLLLGRR